MRFCDIGILLGVLGLLGCGTGSSDVYKRQVVHRRRRPSELSPLVPGVVAVRAGRYADRASDARTAVAARRAVAVLEQRPLDGRTGRHRYRRRDPQRAMDSGRGFCGAGAVAWSDKVRAFLSEQCGQGR